MATRIVSGEDEFGLKDAIASTESEIFSEANGTEPLEKTGDRSLEEMGQGLEGKDEPEELEAQNDKQDDQPGEPEDKADEPPRDERGRFAEAERKGIPSARLKEESDKRRQAESERDAVKTQLAELNAKLDALSRQQQQPKQQPQEQPKQDVPDMFAEPEKWQQHVLATAAQNARAIIVENSLSDAADTHGEKFTQAYTELQRIGHAEKAQFGSSATVNKIWAAPNPGKALMKWHSEQAAIREVGSDPQAWLEKQLEQKLSDPEFLAKAIERAKGNAKQGDDGRPRNVTRMPPSLNSMTGGSHQVADPDAFDNSEGSVFNFATR